MLKSDTVAGARNNTALTPKFDGFHKCRPLNRSTYLDAIEIRAGQHIRPEEWRPHQNADADTGDIRAGRVQANAGT